MIQVGISVARKSTLCISSSIVLGVFLSQRPGLPRGCHIFGSAPGLSVLPELEEQPGSGMSRRESTAPWSVKKDVLRPPRYLEKWGNLIHSWFSDFWILLNAFFYVRLEGLSGRFHEYFFKTMLLYRCLIYLALYIIYIYTFIPINVYKLFVGVPKRKKHMEPHHWVQMLGPPKSPSYVCWIVFTGPTADITIINASCSSK